MVLVKWGRMMDPFCVEVNLNQKGILEKAGGGAPNREFASIIPAC
jgi:hypothetical protein